MSTNSATNTAHDELRIQLEENVRLRAALAHSKSPCVYCSLPQEEWSKCKQGFPGCARADDAMGCPELGAAMELAELKLRMESRVPLINGRFGDWIQTSRGGQFWPLDPRPEEIFIEDIAAALSRQCRYAGQLRSEVDLYSTAEHSALLCKYFLDREDIPTAKWALLHDSSEAYLYDVTRPLKKYFPEYTEAERVLMQAICAKFELPEEEPRILRDADRRILTDERMVVMAPAPIPWSTDDEPLGVKVMGFAPWYARRMFMKLFVRLWPEEKWLK